MRVLGVSLGLLLSAAALAQTPTQPQSFTESGLYGFPCSPACPASFFPEGSLLQASDGNSYGATNGGATGYGAVFKITPSGTLTPLYSFCSRGAPQCADGGGSVAGLVAVGEFQINFTVPQSFANQPAALYPISVQVAGVSSPTTIETSPPQQILIPIQP